MKSNQYRTIEDPESSFIAVLLLISILSVITMSGLFIHAWIKQHHCHATTFTQSTLTH